MATQTPSQKNTPKAQPSAVGLAYIKKLSLKRTIGLAVAVLAIPFTLYFFGEAISAGFAGHTEDENTFNYLGILFTLIMITGIVFGTVNNDRLKKERTLQRVAPDPPGSRSHVYLKTSRVLIILALAVFVCIPLVNLAIFLLSPR